MIVLTSLICKDSGGLEGMTDERGQLTVNTHGGLTKVNRAGRPDQSCIQQPASVPWKQNVCRKNAHPNVVPRTGHKNRH